MARKYYARVEATYSDKPSSLLQHEISCDCKNLYGSGPSRKNKENCI